MHALAAPPLQAGDVADATEAAVDGLVYLRLDAVAFDVGSTDPGAHRIYAEATGVQSANATPLVTTPRYVDASLPIHIGSAIRKSNVSDVGQPTISIAQRTLGENTLKHMGRRQAAIFSRSGFTSLQNRSMVRFASASVMSPVGICSTM